MAQSDIKIIRGHCLKTYYLFSFVCFCYRRDIVQFFFSIFSAMVKFASLLKLLSFILKSRCTSMYLSNPSVTDKIRPLVDLASLLNFWFLYWNVVGRVCIFQHFRHRQNESPLSVCILVKFVDVWTVVVCSTRMFSYNPSVTDRMWHQVDFAFMLKSESFVRKCCSTSMNLSDATVTDKMWFSSLLKLCSFLLKCSTRIYLSNPSVTDKTWH